MCDFLIDVMWGKVERTRVGHRVSAARELLNRAFGRNQGIPLPKPPRRTAPRGTIKRTDLQVQTAEDTAPVEEKQSTAPPVPRPERACPVLDTGVGVRVKTPFVLSLSKDSRNRHTSPCLPPFVPLKIRRGGSLPKDSRNRHTSPCLPPFVLLKTRRGGSLSKDSRNPYYPKASPKRS